MDHSIREDFRDWYRQLPHRPRRLMALTGAGMSAESGLPTFRSHGDDALWRQVDPMMLFVPEALERDPLLAWQFYDDLRGRMAAAPSNPGHLALAALERRCALALATQNIDGLHQRAGSTEVIELHGTVWRLCCMRCAYQEENDTTPLPALPPRCPRCGDILRPDIVLFTETLPAEALSRAIQAAEQCDLMLVIGTSGVIYPANGLPSVARKHGARLIEVNPEETALTPLMDFTIRATTVAALPWLADDIAAAE